MSSKLRFNSRFYTWEEVETKALQNMPEIWTFLQAIRAYEASHPENRKFPPFQIGGAVHVFFLQWTDCVDTNEKRALRLSFFPQAKREGDKLGSLKVVGQVLGGFGVPGSDTFVFSGQDLERLEQTGVPELFKIMLKPLFSYITEFKETEWPQWPAIIVGDSVYLIAPKKSMVTLNVANLMERVEQRDGFDKVQENHSEVKEASFAVNGVTPGTSRRTMMMGSLGSSKMTEIYLGKSPPVKVSEARVVNKSTYSISEHNAEQYADVYTLLPIKDMQFSPGCTGSFREEKK